MKVILFLFSLLVLVGCNPYSKGPDGKSPLQLKIPDHKAFANGYFSYALKSEHLQGASITDNIIIELVSDGDSGIEVVEGKTLARLTPFASVGEYLIEGTISNGEQSSQWSFTLKIEVPDQIQLALSLQSVREGRDFNYNVKVGDVLALPANQVYSIVLVEDGGSGITYDPTQNSFSLASAPAGIYWVEGSIALGETKSPWSFVFNVPFNPPPQITIEAQTVEAGDAFSLTLPEDSITGVSEDETAVLVVTSDDGAVVVVNNLALASADRINTMGVYVVNGTISDGYKDSEWSFNLNVVDTIPPVLNVIDQFATAGIEFTYVVDPSSDISDLRQGENFIIDITDDDGSGLSYNNETKAFSLTTPVAGDYTIEGTISDGTNLSEWSFDFSVLEGMSLKISRQAINEGQNFSYTIVGARDIVGWMGAEEFVISLGNNGHSSISYNATSKTFTGTSLSFGRYVIEGTITSRDMTLPWSFLLLVNDVTPPQLSVSEQILTHGTEFTYSLNENNDISQVRSGERYQIIIRDHDNTYIGYNDATKTFTGDTRGLPIRSYTLSGAIQDEENPPNSSPWTFDIVVKDLTAPQLRVTNKSIREGDRFTHTLSEGNDISQLRSGESYRIIVDDHDNTNISYNPTTKIFSGDTSNLPMSTYTIEGRIEDGETPANSNSWTFDLVVQDGTAPRLSIAERTLTEGSRFSYTLNEGNDILDRRSGEDYEIIVVDQDNIGISYNPTTKVFSGDTRSLAVGTHTVDGRNEDGETPANSNSWTLILWLRI